MSWQLEEARSIADALEHDCAGMEEENARLRAEVKDLRARITQARRLLQTRGALERLSALDCLDLKRKNWRQP